jgi:hypothetical protein
MSQKYGCSLARFTHAEDFVIHASTKENGASFFPSPLSLLFLSFLSSFARFSAHPF